MYNTENACVSSSTALNLVRLAVVSGQCEKGSRSGVREALA